MRSKNLNMTEGPIFKQIVIVFIPILLTRFLQQFFNAADVILAGNLGTSGSDAVAAVGSTTSITKLMISFFTGCSTGSSVVLSQAIGSKQKDDIKKAVHTAVLLSFILGAILTVAGTLVAKPILVAISTPKNILDLACAYLRTYFLGMIPLMLYSFCSAILHATGDTKKPLYYLLISGVVKLILTIVFVSLLKLDVVGVALAGTCSQFVSALLALIALIKRNDECKLYLKELRIYKKTIKRILSLGIPSGIQTATFSLSSVFIQSSANTLSNIEGFIAGNAAATSFEGLTDSLTTAFYQTAIIFMGHNVGANKYDRIKKGYIQINLFSLFFTLAASAVICIFSKQIMGIYLTDSTKAIYWGSIKLICLFSFLVFQGTMDIAAGSLKGLGVSFSSMLISLLGVCGVRMVWVSTVFLIPKYHTPQTLFACYPISWIVTTVFATIIFIIVFKKQKTKFSKKQEVTAR